jgi:RNA polymerase sigma factor (sigma-70 family)
MSQAMPTESPSSANDSLGDPALRRALSDFVRRRVPSAEVDDVVQTVLVEALAAPNRPRDPAELKRWLLGIARHKVVDHHRRATREPPTELPELEASPAPLEARSLVEWAEEQAGSEGEAQKTLAWMAREGEGEKLEAIAAEEKVPAARVRQRVSRMRRWMKERWTAELAAVAMLGVLALAAWWLLTRERPEADKHPDVAPTIAPEPPSPLERARVLRADALRACERKEWRSCLDRLDEARGLDPDGDRAPAIGAARQQAEDGLRDGAKDAPQSTAAPVIPAPTAKSSADAKDETPSYEKKPSPTKSRKTKEPPPSKEDFFDDGKKDVKPPAPTPKGAATPGYGKKKLRASTTKVLDTTRY